mmetsp:Transcript_56083/g.121304  ORF Transcript_56083/g.121304 Transcript_56083/m.121304 type:complete len:204 (+) Transcript_56083:196-807(+)
MLPLRLVVLPELLEARQAATLALGIAEGLPLLLILLLQALELDLPSLPHLLDLALSLWLYQNRLPAWGLDRRIADPEFFGFSKLLPLLLEEGITQSTPITLCRNMTDSGLDQLSGISHARGPPRRLSRWCLLLTLLRDGHGRHHKPSQLSPATSSGPCSSLPGAHGRIDADLGVETSPIASRKLPAWQKPRAEKTRHVPVDIE